MYLNDNEQQLDGFFSDIGKKVKKLAKKASYVLPGVALIVPNKDTAKGAAVSLAVGGTIATAVVSPKAGATLGKKLYDSYKDVKAGKKAASRAKKEAAAYNAQTAELEQQIRDMDKNPEPKNPLLPLSIGIALFSLFK